MFFIDNIPDKPGKNPHNPLNLYLCLIGCCSVVPLQPHCLAGSESLLFLFPSRMTTAHQEVEEGRSKSQRTAPRRATSSGAHCSRSATPSPTIPTTPSLAPTHGQQRPVCLPQSKSPTRPIRPGPPVHTLGSC